MGLQMQRIPRLTVMNVPLRKKTFFSRVRRSKTVTSTGVDEAFHFLFSSKNTKKKEIIIQCHRLRHRPYVKQKRAKKYRQLKVFIDE
jgi:hypothetical protein